jgi:hypothetical protein
MPNILKTFALPLVLCGLALTSTAAAQEWGVRFDKHTRHGHFSVGVGSRGVDSHGRSSYGRSRHVHGPNCMTGGNYRTVREQVWVPGRTRQVWVPAQYDYYTDRFGCAQRRMVRPGHYDYVQEPGCYEWRERRVWVPAGYSCGRAVTSSRAITRRW